MSWSFSGITSDNRNNFCNRTHCIAQYRSVTTVRFHFPQFLPIRTWPSYPDCRVIQTVQLSSAEELEWLEHRTPDRKGWFRAKIVEIGGAVIYRPFGNFTELNRTVTCMVLKANDRRTSSLFHDEFRGPRSDCIRQVALETTATKVFELEALCLK
ncbi:hypothetical protein TNCV_1652211 [Trichonephila clavipes]|nr:hypothetical protein TNCV_1652211 [Trichonephila clavipes]